MHKSYHTHTHIHAHATEYTFQAPMKEKTTKNQERHLLLRHSDLCRSYSCFCCGARFETEFLTKYLCCPIADFCLSASSAPVVGCISQLELEIDFSRHTLLPCELENWNSHYLHRRIGHPPPFSTHQYYSLAHLNCILLNSSSSSPQNLPLF